MTQVLALAQKQNAVKWGVSDGEWLFLPHPHAVMVQVTDEEATAQHQAGATAVPDSRGKAPAEYGRHKPEEQPLAGRVVYQEGEGDADSDDEDQASAQQPLETAPPSSGHPASGENVFTDEHALNEEVERLMMALQGSAAAETTTSCDSSCQLVPYSLDCFRMLLLSHTGLV